jgi:hypothetical protein
MNQGLGGRPAKPGILALPRVLDVKLIVAQQKAAISRSTSAPGIVPRNDSRRTPGREVARKTARHARPALGIRQFRWRLKGLRLSGTRA